MPVVKLRAVPPTRAVETDAYNLAMSAPEQESWKSNRIASAVAGTNPTVIARLRSGFAVIGDVQFLPGYCVLLAAPQVVSLDDLPLQARQTFLSDMALVGEAVSNVCRADGFRRINYEILGNSDEFLHAHIWPRYEWEPDERRAKPVWLYEPDAWTRNEHQLSNQHAELRNALSNEVERLKVHYYDDGGNE